MISAGPKHIGARVVVALMAAAAFWSTYAVSFSTATVGAPDSIGIRLTEVDAASAGDPRARLYIIDRVAPGTTLTRTIEISNISNLAHKVGVYASGASIVKGAFIGDDGAIQNELSSWVSLSRQTLLLAPHGASKISVSVKVPKNASESERYGVVWAEVRSTATSGLISVNRVGIRVYLSVGAGSAPPSSFEIRSLAGTRDANGTPIVEAVVSNTGGRALDLSGQLSLTDGPGELSAGPFTATLGTTLAIGASDIVRVNLSKAITSGPWHATLTLHSGLITSTGEATISFPSHGKNPPVHVDQFAPWLFWILLAIVLAVATALAWFIAYNRGGHRKPQHLNSPRH